MSRALHTDSFNSTSCSQQMAQKGFTSSTHSQDVLGLKHTCNVWGAQPHCTVLSIEAFLNIKVDLLWWLQSLYLIRFVLFRAVFSLYVALLQPLSSLSFRPPYFHLIGCPSQKEGLNNRLEGLLCPWRKIEVSLSLTVITCTQAELVAWNFGHV